MPLYTDQEKLNIAAMERLFDTTNVDKTIEAFHKLDKDNSGTVDEQEVRVMNQSAALCAPHQHQAHRHVYRHHATALHLSG